MRTVSGQNELSTITASFICVACGVPSCSVPQDGCPILYYQGQGKTGQTGAQEDLHHCLLHTDQPVSLTRLFLVQMHMHTTSAVMSEFLHLNNHVV